MATRKYFETFRSRVVVNPQRLSLSFEMYTTGMDCGPRNRLNLLAFSLSFPFSTERESLLRAKTEYPVTLVHLIYMCWEALKNKA